VGDQGEGGTPQEIGKSPGLANRGLAVKDMQEQNLSFEDSEDGFINPNLKEMFLQRLLEDLNSFFGQSKPSSKPGILLDLRDVRSAFSHFRIDTEFAKEIIDVLEADGLVQRTKGGILVVGRKREFQRCERQEYG